MRMRRKKWARPELAVCPYYCMIPRENRGKWRVQFPQQRPLHVELGCGKGVSTAQMVHANPDINYVAVDLSRDVLGHARRNIEAAYENEEVDNVILTAINIEYITDYFCKEDSVERIYISFCNPWSEKSKHEKRRLTHSRQLSQYRTFLVDEGEIWFKTDDDMLFEASLEYFDESGFDIKYLSRDLHASGFTPNYLSEYEIKFTAEDVPTKFLIAVKKSVDAAL